MTRALSTVAAVALLAAGAWWLLSTMAGLEAAGPAPDVDARLRAGSAATVAAREAAGERPDPVTFSMTFEGRPSRMAVAGAKRQLTAGGTWSGVLQVLNQTTGPAADKAITYSTSMSGLGAAVAIENLPIGIDGTWCRGGDPMEHGAEDPPYDPETPDERWWGLYHPFTVSAQVGMDTDEQLVWLWHTDFFGLPSFHGSPIGGIIVKGPDLAITTTATLTNVFVRGYRSAHPPSSRQTMDFTDLRGNEEWVGDENSIITVTATGPGGISLSAQGNMGYEGETALGPNPFLYSAGFTVNNFPEQGVVYAQVSGLDTAAAAEVWYAPSPNPANVPNVHQPNWSRDIADADAHEIRVSLAGGTLAIRRDGTPMTGGRAFSVPVRRPYIVTLVPQP